MAHRIVQRGTRDVLGEGVMWSARRNAIFWVDIKRPTVHRLDLADQRVTSWPMPEPIGWIIERDGRDDFMVGLKSGFATLALDPFAVAAVGDPEPDRPHNRLNDAKVDRWGRIWAGTMDDREEVASGALYCLSCDGTWMRHDDGHAVTNGPAFSPCGSVMYHTDSLARTIFRHAIRDDGSIGPREVFLVFDEAWGYPDGMTCDNAGGLWVAHWAGGRISRFRNDATLDRSIPLPATNVTNVAFAGDGLERLFVTTASYGRDHESSAGALFEILDHAATGCPSRCFGG